VTGAAASESLSSATPRDSAVLVTDLLLVLLSCSWLLCSKWQDHVLHWSTDDRQAVQCGSASDSAAVREPNNYSCCEHHESGHCAQQQRCTAYVDCAGEFVDALLTRSSCWQQQASAVQSTNSRDVTSVLAHVVLGFTLQHRCPRNITATGVLGGSMGHRIRTELGDRIYIAHKCSLACR
jgi:hypothetical protein